MLKKFSAELKKQFVEQHRKNVAEKLRNYITSKKMEINLCIRFFLSKYYLIFWIISMVFGLVLFIVWTRLFDDNDEILNPDLTIILTVSLGLTIVSFFSLIIINPIRKKASSILNKKIDHNEFFRLIFEDLGEFKFHNSKDKLLPSLVRYRRVGFPEIGKDATIFKYSPLFSFEFNDYFARFQTQAWTWEHILNRKKTNIYANVGMLELELNHETSKEFNEFQFSLIQDLTKNSLLHDFYTSNSEFDERFKLRTNNDQISSLIFNEDVQNGMLKIANSIDLLHFQIQKIENSILIKFLPSSPRVLKLNFHYADNFKKEVDYWTINTLNEIYQVFALMSLVIRPNYEVSCLQEQCVLKQEKILD
ncbi:hypothetical protein [Mycoplasma testudineum]|nr:hypothetical protein [Mycoplasma testudineum]